MPIRDSKSKLEDSQTLEGLHFGYEWNFVDLAEIFAGLVSRGENIFIHIQKIIDGTQGKIRRCFREKKMKSGDVLDIKDKFFWQRESRVSRRSRRHL